MQGKFCTDTFAVLHILCDSQGRYDREAAVDYMTGIVWFCDDVTEPTALPAMLPHEGADLTLP